KASSSPSDSKRVARPETMCSTRPAKPASRRNSTTNALSGSRSGTTGFAMARPYGRGGPDILRRFRNHSDIRAGVVGAARSRLQCAMARDRSIRFGPFALDPANARLCRGDEVVPLRGKTLAVLEHLIARPGQLVTKDELLDAVWPDVHVSEDVLVGCVRELRNVFGDTRGAARFVETVYRRGYRWIAGVDGASEPAEVAAT